LWHSPTEEKFYKQVDFSVWTAKGNFAEQLSWPGGKKCIEVKHLNNQVNILPSQDSAHLLKKGQAWLSSHTQPLVSSTTLWFYEQPSPAQWRVRAPALFTDTYLYSPPTSLWSSSFTKTVTHLWMGKLLLCHHANFPVFPFIYFQNPGFHHWKLGFPHCISAMCFWSSPKKKNQ
jgi:hypothetical protein